MDIFTAIWHQYETTVSPGAQRHRTIENTPALVNANRFRCCPEGAPPSAERNAKAFVRARRLHADSLHCIVLHDMLWHWERHRAKALGTVPQGAPMPFTMDDFHDLIRLIETRPEWRAEVRSG